MIFLKDESNHIITDIFSGVAAAELKYRLLIRNRRNYDRIVELVRIVADDPDRGGVWAAHKEFAMVTFIVDWWIEPLAYENGLNLYKDGANLAMANMLFCCLQGFWDDAFRRRVLMHFQRMFRARTKEAFAECEVFVRRQWQRARGSQAELLGYLWPSFQLLGYDHVVGLPRRVLDVALPGLIYIGHTWRSRHEGDLEAVHDQSTNMAKQRWLWDALSSPVLGTATFAHRSGSQVFPMNVVSTRFADSAQDKQLQICDVLAGATSAFLQKFNKGDADAIYYERSIEAGLEKLHIGGLWPSTEVTADGLEMKGLDANKAIEWVSRQLRSVRPPDR
jgi:hypothetical protein